MKMRTIRLTLVSLGILLIVPATAGIVTSHFLSLTNNIDSPRIAALAHQHANLTVEQHLAVSREIQAELHPLWKNLSWSGRLNRSAMLAKRLLQMSDAAAPAAAQFQGNLTVITGPSGNAIGLQRQGNCSLSLYNGTYTLSLAPTIQVVGTTPNYERTLHGLAGLTTTPDVFANGCSDTTLGIGSRRGAYLGKTTQNLYMFAGSGYDNTASQNALYYGTLDPTFSQIHSFNTDLSLPGIIAVAAGDLNGDGLADIVGINAAAASISVWLAKADGTLGSPTSYVLPGNATVAAVLADVNGDGKVDVVVATNGGIASVSQEQISVLTGKGDGTLNAAQSFPVPTPSTASGSFPIANLIAANLRGTGTMDLVASNGLVLLNNGSGTFTVGSSAFAPSNATSEFGPNLVAADFNKDGKLDIAVSNGVSIALYTGNGDGTFTGGKSYVTINDVGYLTAADLDGDGNIDLYVGLANGGLFGGDQFAVNQAYALMGNGDGSLQGAPNLPFMYTGQNIADLNGDKIEDAVGVNADGSLTSYLGNGKGGFTAKATLITSPITLGGTKYTLNGIDSLSIGDVNGDGIPDLAYIANAFAGPGGTPGIFVALGNGQGGFAAPTFYSVQSTLSSGDIDNYWTISDLHLADVNHDGKADLIYSYSDTSTQKNITYFGTVVQLGNGNETFQNPLAIPFRSAPYTEFPALYNANVVLTADLNKDGNLDLVFLSPTVTGTIDSTLSTYVQSIQVALGKGDGTFSAPTTVSGPANMSSSIGYYGSVVVADMNGDGIPDIVALGASASYSEQVGVSLGNGDGTFKAPLLTTYSAQYLNNSQGLAVADFDGDGKQDVAITDPYDPTGSGISLGRGDGTLQAMTDSGGTVPNLAINLLVGGPTVALDLNGDGKPDMISGTTVLLGMSGNAPSGGSVSGDFSLGGGTSMGTVAPGHSVMSTITLSPIDGFAQTVSLSCSGLPAGAACAFSPPSVTVNGSTATSTLTITTTAATALNLSRDRFNPLVPGGALLAGLMAPLFLRRRSFGGGSIHLAWLTLALVCGFFLQACGGGSGASNPSGSSASSGGPSNPGGNAGTPAGTYSVTITATGGSITHTTSYTLTVS